MKRFFAEWNTWFPSKTATLIVFGFILIAQFGYITFYSAGNVGHRSEVGAVDDDGGWNIQKTTITRWYKDNGWSLYGPMYFRINHTLNKLFPTLKNRPGLTPGEAEEMSASLAISITSAVSLFAIAFLLAFILLESWAERLALTVVLSAAILSNELWAEFVIRAHPDLLFAAFAAWAGYFTWRMLHNDFDRVDYRGSAVLWGLATAVKLSIGLFLPGLIFFVLKPFSKPAVKRAAFYALWMFGAYFVIGFPQTVTLDRPVRHVLAQNKFSSPADWPTYVKWFELFADQLWRPALVILVIALFAARRRFSFKPKPLLWMWIFFAVSTFMLVSRKISSPADHYTFPFSAIFWVLLAVTVLPLSSLFADRLRKGPEFVRAALILLVFWPLTWGYIPESFSAALAKHQRCRPEAREAHEILRKKVEDGHFVFVDPYVPYPTEHKDKKLINEWGLTFENLHRRDFDVIALNRNFDSAFTREPEPTDYTKNDVPDWQPKREFYKVFSGKDEALDQQGRLWKRTYSNECGVDIYER